MQQHDEAARKWMQHDDAARKWIDFPPTDFVPDLSAFLGDCCIVVKCDCCVPAGSASMKECSEPADEDNAHEDVDKAHEDADYAHEDVDNAHEDEDNAHEDEQNQEQLHFEQENSGDKEMLFNDDDEHDYEEKNHGKENSELVDILPLFQTYLEEQKQELQQKKEFRAFVQKCPNLSVPVETSDAEIPQSVMPQSILVLPRRGQPARKYTIDDVEQNMHLRQSDAAKRLKMSVSCLKKLCKQFGINKWPRQIPETVLNKLLKK